jgi:cytochrome c556
MAYKSALIADVAKAHQDQGQNKKKDWLRLTDEMRRSSLELAETAKAKKPKETKTALNKLTASCNDCHAAFRDK